MDFPRASAIIAVLFFIYLLAQFYLFVRVRDYLGHWPRHHRLLSALVFSFFLLMLYPVAWYLFGLRSYEPYIEILRGIVAFWAFGSTGLLLIFLAHDAFGRAWRYFSSRPETPVDLQRRDFLQKGLGVVAAAPFLVSGYGVLLERHRFRVEHFDLPLTDLSTSLSHLTIVHLSDIHVGPFMTGEELRAYVEAVNKLDPDLVALTGDFVATHREEADPCVAALAGLKARHGIFACMGNHDVYAGAENDLTRLLSQRGVRVLRNDAASIQLGNTDLTILGIDDFASGNSDLSRALARERPGEARLLLSHRPEIFPQASRRGVDIVLSGHYHGGQVKLGRDPESLSIARLLTPYPEGLYHLSRRRNPAPSTTKDSVLFVSRGIGITGLPIRVNCPPQIAHLQLVNNRKA